MWRRKRAEPPAVTEKQVQEALDGTDVDEARRLRAEATGDMRALKAQAPLVSRLADILIERRRLNHFGEELTVTFTPRRSHG